MFLQILPDRGIFLLCNTCIFVGELDLSRLVPLELWLNQQHFFCAKFGLIHSFSICLLSTDKDDLGTVSYFAHVVYHGKEPRFLLPWIPPGFRQGETLVKRWEKWGGRGEAWLALWFSPCPRSYCVIAVSISPWHQLSPDHPLWFQLPSGEPGPWTTVAPPLPSVPPAWEWCRLVNIQTDSLSLFYQLHHQILAFTSLL